MGVALIAGHNFYGYNDCICRGFIAEGWDCEIEPVRPPRVRTSFGARLFYRTLPRRLGLRWPLAAAEAWIREDFVRRVCARDVDLVVFIRPDVLRPEDLARIRAARPRALLVAWLLDPAGRMPGVEELLPCFDAVFVYDAGDLPRVRQLNASSWGLPMAYDPRDYHPPREAVEPRWALSFVGAPAAHRLRLLERICRDLDLAPDQVRFVVGRWSALPLIGQRRLARRSWLFRDGYLDLETLDHPEVREVYHHSTVCLNIHKPGTTSGYNPRIFEIAGAEGAQVVERLPGLEEQLSEGRELLCYEGADELVERIRWLLEAPHEAREMGRRAAAAVAARHTYQHRVRALLSALETR